MANDVLSVLHQNTSLAMDEPLKVDVWLVSSDIYQLQQKINPFLAVSVKYLLVKFTFRPHCVECIHEIYALGKENEGH